MKSPFPKIISLLLTAIMVIGTVPISALAADVSNSEPNESSSTAEAPEGYIPKNTFLENVGLLSDDLDAEAETAPRVLLIEDVLPWDSTANQAVLGKICDYDKTTTKNFLNVELENYGVVVFANDQPFNTYENYAEFKEYLELFASLGGVIVFGACDAGWSDGNLTEKLPGDVSKKTHYVKTNYITDPAHLIVTGALTDGDALLDEDLSNKYCSHVSFDEETLPAGSKIILRESDSDRPTLVEYPLGEGRVIASGLTWEHAYGRAGTYIEGTRVGAFSKKAMEDMFRYAIRVSSIDVDELQKLEDWRINKKAHTIIVSDSSNGFQSLASIEGAVVSVTDPASHAGETLTTDTNGVVTTTDYGLRTVSITVAGYRNYEELYQIKEQTSRIIPLVKDKGDGLPYLTMCSAAKNGNQDFVDLRSQALYFTEGTDALLLLWLRGNWGTHGDGYFRVYQESSNGAPGKEFQVLVGNYLNITPGKYFVPGVPVKVQMVAADGVKSEIVELNLEIDKAPVVGGPTENTAIQEFTKVDWLGNFPIQSDNEIFTKLLTTDMSVSSDLIPVEFVIDHKDDGTISYKGTIGFLKGEGSKNIKNNKSQESDFGVDSAWNTLKEEIKGYQKAGNPREYWKKIDKKYGEMLHGTRLRSSIDTDFKFLGFIEITTDQNGKIISSDGGIISSASASLVIGKTFFAGPVPLYFEFKPGLEAEISGGVTFYNEENGLTFKLNFNGLDLSIPKISLEGGVGVRGVATAGLNGTGKLKFGFLHENAPVNVDLSLDGSVHIKVLFVADYNWSFASTNIHFYPKARTAAELLDLAMYEMDADSLELTSRSYLANESQWTGAPISLLALGDGSVATATLQEGTMPDTMPQIHQINGKQIMLFLRDVASKATGNHTQLVYSIENNGVWSEPQPVSKQDTADFFFSSAVCNGKLVVTWQKSKASVESTDVDALLGELAENSEICVAVFDETTGTFAEERYITENDIVDMMPVVSADEENTYITWVANDANDVLGQEGNYLVSQAKLDGDNTTASVLYSTTEYVVELAAGGDKVLIAVANDDGTTNLYSVSGDTADRIAANTHAAGLSWNDSVFTWQKDGSLYSYAPATGTTEEIIAADAALSSSYEYITNGAETAVVWTESDEAGYAVKAVFRYGDTWSAPTELLSGQDDTVAFMDAQMLADGSISLIMNAVSYDNNGAVATTSLQYANVMPQTNLSLTLADPEYPDWEKQTQQIDLVLENTGERPISSVDLRIETDDTTLYSDTLAVTLLPGTSTVLSPSVDIREIGTVTDCTISVDTDSDADDSDNTQRVVLGKTDAALTVDTYIQGEEYLFVLTAENRSNTVANAAISIVEDQLDGVVLSMKNIGIVDHNENVQYLYTIDRSKIDFAGAETKTFFFTLSTLEDDWFEDDNICTYTIMAPTTEVIDPTGDITVVPLVESDSIAIAEEALHFDSAEAESVQLHATVLPADATNAKVFWKAADDSVVYINENGVVTPLKAGNTVITASLSNGISDTIQVSVADTTAAAGYRIQFHPNGGSGSMADITDVPAGAFALPVCTFTAPSGMRFKGWATSSDGPVIESLAVTGDTTLYAIWEAIPTAAYTVIFDANGGACSTASAITGTDGKLSHLPDATRTGYTFAGWYTAMNGGTKISTSTVFTDDATVYAHWDYVSTPSVSSYYTLTFDVNGGTEISAIRKASGTMIDLSNYIPTREGYVFDGWFSDATLIHKITSLRLTQNTTVYAGWTTSPEPHDNPFRDVFAYDWYYQSVMYAYENGLMTGVSADRFDPEANLSRAMIAQVIYNLEGVTGGAPNVFTDVPSGMWYTSAVNWAAQQGLISGYGNSCFGPDDSVTREQLAVILYRYAQYKGYDDSASSSLSAFSDGNSASDWAVDALVWAVDHGVMTGKGGNILDPTGTATRAEVAQMFMNYLTAL